MLSIIPMPPAPALPAEIAYPAAGAACLIGLLLLLWGRKVHRFFLVLAGAGIGFLVCPLVTDRLGMVQHANAVRFVAVFTLAIMSLVLARVVWSLLAGALGLVGAAVGICWRVGSLVQQHQPTTCPSPTTDLGQWAQDVSQYVATWVGAVLPVLPPMMYVFAAACLAVPLLIVLVWPRLGAIVMSSLVGAVLAVGGGACACVQARPDLWATLLANWVVVAALAGGLMLVGWVVQARSAIRQARSRQESEQGETPEPSDKGSSKPAPADKKAKSPKA